MVSKNFQRWDQGKTVQYLAQPRNTHYDLLLRLFSGWNSMPNFRPEILIEFWRNSESSFNLRRTPNRIRLLIRWVIANVACILPGLFNRLDQSDGAEPFGQPLFLQEGLRQSSTFSTSRFPKNGERSHESRELLSAGQSLPCPGRLPAGFPVLLSGRIITDSILNFFCIMTSFSGLLRFFLSELYSVGIWTLSLIKIAGFWSLALFAPKFGRFCSRVRPSCHLTQTVQMHKRLFFGHSEKNSWWIRKKVKQFFPKTEAIFLRNSRICQPKANFFLTFSVLSEKFPRILPQN